jgi:hypothetical protein
MPPTARFETSIKVAGDSETEGSAASSSSCQFGLPNPRPCSATCGYLLQIYNCSSAGYNRTFTGCTVTVSDSPPPAPAKMQTGADVQADRREGCSLEKGSGFTWFSMKASRLSTGWIVVQGAEGGSLEHRVDRVGEGVKWVVRASRLSVVRIPGPGVTGAAGSPGLGRGRSSKGRPAAHASDVAS